MIADLPTTWTPGVYPNVPMSDYIDIDAASNHGLSLLRRSPAHYKAALEETKEDTTALLVGRACHTAILEPDYFDMLFAVAQQCEATKKGDGLPCNNAGILFRADLGWLCGVHGKGLATDETRLILSPDDHQACLGARDAVYRHPAAKAMLSGPGSVELTACWRDLATLTSCKARFDRHSPEFAAGTIIDIKTCRDASRREFERSVFSLGYHRQGAMYLEAARNLGLPAEHFVIVAVEKTPPFAVAVYRLTEGALALGAEQIDHLLARYAKCVETGEWPAYPDDVQDISLPDYAWRQVDQELMEAVA